MDIDAYMNDVKDRLSAAARRRDAARSEVLNPLAPLRSRKHEEQSKLIDLTEQIRAEKQTALSELKASAQQRRAQASREAAQIYEEADRQAKELRRKAREDSERERNNVLAIYAQRLDDETGQLRERVASMQQQEAAALTEVADELSAAENEYREEYAKVVAERIITRKALASMGFQAPTRRKEATVGAVKQQRAGARA